MAIGGSTTPSKTNDVDGGHKAKGRNNNPGVRLVGNRIYCPLNGKTCHQCRQKTLDFAAFCRNLKGNKECPIKFCQKCLKNRYGENASDVAKLDDWKCPKCRGICNCSFCMKKRGQKPTGILVHAAKNCGFGSVSEMLSLASPDTSDNARVVCSPRKLGKENSPKKNNALSLGGEGRMPKANRVSSKKRKFEGRVAVGNNLSESDVPHDEAGNDLVSIEGNMSKVADSMELARPNKFSNYYACHKGNDNPETFQRDEEVLVAGNPIKENKSSRRRRDTNSMLLDVPLPQGKILTTLCAIELPIEVIGDALQFLEFCSAFGKVIDLRKGEAEVIVRELLSGRPKRNGRESSLIRIHVKLLSIIMEDSGKESSNENSTVRRNSWLRDVENCLSESALASKWLSGCSFDGGLSDYDELDLTGKFRLLNFLCDEALGTEPFRSWIEDQNQKFRENGKIAKEKLMAAKDKEKQQKQKLLSEVAEAVISKNGAPMSIYEHEAVVAKVKHEIAEARSEIAQIADLPWKKRQRSDAVRTQPILVDPRGLAFWKLSASIGEVDVLLQGHRIELSSSGSDEYEEKWLSYDEGEKEAVNKYISSRMSLKIRKVNPQSTDL